MTTKPPHTPGPWQVWHYGSQGGERHFVIVSAARNSLGGYLPFGDADADRLLIESAPDLLAACEAAVQFLATLAGIWQVRAENGEVHPDAVANLKAASDAMLAATARARGETP